MTKTLSPFFRCNAAFKAYTVRYILWSNRNFNQNSVLALKEQSSFCGTPTCKQEQNITILDTFQDVFRFGGTLEKIPRHTC